MLTRLGKNLEKLKIQDIHYGSQEKKNVEMSRNNRWTHNERELGDRIIGRKLVQGKRY